MWESVNHHADRIMCWDFTNLTAACNQLWAASSDTDQQCETDFQSLNQETTAKLIKWVKAYLKKVFEKAL